MLRPGHLLKLLHSSPAQRRYLLAAAWMLCLVRLSLCIFSFSSILRYVESIGPRAARAPKPGQPEIEQFARALAIAGRLIPQASCLTQAIALQLFLARRGLQGQLHIGVTKDDESSLKAHAWVERHGRILVGQRGSRNYIKLVTFGGEKL